MKVRLKFFPKHGADLSSVSFNLTKLCLAMQKGRTFKIKVMCDDQHRKAMIGEKYFTGSLFYAPDFSRHEDHLGRVEIESTE